MPVKLIWRLRRKQQITKRYFTTESKQKMKVCYGAGEHATGKAIQVTKE